MMDRVWVPELNSYGSVIETLDIGRGEFYRVRLDDGRELHLDPIEVTMNPPRTHGR